MDTLQSFVDRFRDLFEILSDGVVVWQLDGRIVAGNDAMATILGCTVDELPGMDLGGFLSPEDVGRVMEGQQQQIKGEAVSQRYELGLVRKDGTRVIGELVTRLVSEKGGPEGVLAIVKNITAQKKAQKALQEERDKAQRYLDVAGIAIQVIDTNQRLTLMNRKCCQIFGYEEKEIIGENWFDIFIPQRNRPIAKAIFEKLITRKVGPSKCVESPVLTKSGEERIMAWYNTTLLTDETGNAISVLGSGEDITERKQMEQALRDSEKRYRTLFEDSRDAICIITRDGVIVDVNQASLEMFGYSRQEVMGLDVRASSLYYDPGGGERFQREIEQKGYVRDYEMKLRKRDGTAIDCLLTFSVRRDNDGNVLGYEGMVRDVTERKRLQQNMQLYIMQITKAQEEERKRIARELHDETIQGLAILSLDIEAIMRARKRSGDGSIRSLGRIQEKVNHIAEELSRLSHALRPSVLDQLGLVPAVKVLIDDLRKSAKIAASLEILGEPRRLSPEVELGLFRIIQESVSNIRRHSGAARVVTRVEFCPDSVKVVVADDGKGFELPRTLGDFTNRGKLGLVGMQERAQLFNGVFLVQSELGKGTTVSVEVGNLSRLAAVEQLPLPVN
ncbi:MAG: hypothetical protein A2Y91_00240 [Chloroflexi bacterium RBG_13_54_8]|nr:MAG: hypothetical protein A2Y91_00240 [Chloroflexi bacterium RBG_13_54_8]